MQAFLTITALTASLCPFVATAQDAPDMPVQSHRHATPVTPEVHATASIDVVFVLDTTGSMSGLIEGAKEKIWSIANQIATAHPRPEIRMGLVGYRDRGDDYITRLTPLTADLDAVYSDLMKFSAAGGGDGPESVNQALHEAITRFDWSGSRDALKLVYLVGDAPPHMDYQDDVKYHETCELAARSGIIINTIQCGNWTETTPVWQEIARLSEGEFFQIDQSGGMLAIATPFDADLARLGAELEATVIAYGRADEQRAQQERAEVAREIAASAPAAALAERAAYKGGRAGGAALGGEQELLRDLEEGRVTLDAIPAEELPAELKAMSEAERRAHIAARAEERRSIQARIADLSRQRLAHIAEQTAAAGPDSFDRRVLEALRRQAAAKGIRYTD